VTDWMLGLAIAVAAARVRFSSSRYYGAHIRAAPATGRVVSFPRMGPRRRRYDPGDFCTGK